MDNNPASSSLESSTSKLKSALYRQFSMSPRKQALQYSFVSNIKSEDVLSSLNDNNVHLFKLCVPSFKSDESKISTGNTNASIMTEFSIHLEETQFLFKSVSPDENDKWVEKCHESVEHIWMKYCKGKVYVRLKLFLSLIINLKVNRWKK